MLGTTTSRLSGSIAFSIMQLRTEADRFDVEVLVDRLELFAKRDEVLLAASSRRSSPESLTISMRAVSGCERISDEIDVSVLKRKCGLIWLASASTRAAISSFSCSCSRCSMRALFQILIGMATHSTVARTTRA